jgi:transposase
MGLRRPYLVLMTPDAPQRTHALREVLDGLQYVIKTGCSLARDAA